MILLSHQSCAGGRLYVPTTSQMGQCFAATKQIIKKIINEKIMVQLPIFWQKNVYKQAMKVERLMKKVKKGPQWE